MAEQSSTQPATATLIMMIFLPLSYQSRASMGTAGSGGIVRAEPEAEFMGSGPPPSTSLLLEEGRVVE